MSIKIDLSKVKTRDYCDFLSNLDNPNRALPILFKMLDPAIEGGVLDRRITDLPAILSQALKVMNEFGTDINLAIASMSEYLKGKQDD